MLRLLEFFHCLCLSVQDLRRARARGGYRLDRRVRHVESQRMGARCGGVTQRGKGDEPFGSSRGLEFLPCCSPHLAGTCENNSPAFSHSADPIAISTLEGTRVRGNPDRQNREREREKSFNRVGQMPRPVERLCNINILWRLSGSASSPSCVVLCLCVAAAAIAVAKWRTCEHARGKDSTFHFGDFPRCFGPKKDGKDWEE